MSETWQSIRRSLPSPSIQSMRKAVLNTLLVGFATLATFTAYKVSQPNTTIYPEYDLLNQKSFTEAFQDNIRNSRLVIRSDSLGERVAEYEATAEIDSRTTINYIEGRERQEHTKHIVRVHYERTQADSTTETAFSFKFHESGDMTSRAKSLFEHVGTNFNEFTDFTDFNVYSGFSVVYRGDRPVRKRSVDEFEMFAVEETIRGELIDPNSGDATWEVLYENQTWIREDEHGDIGYVRARDSDYAEVKGEGAMYKLFLTDENLAGEMEAFIREQANLTYERGGCLRGKAGSPDRAEENPYERTFICN